MKKIIVVGLVFVLIFLFLYIVQLPHTVPSEDNKTYKVGIETYKGSSTKTLLEDNKTHKIEDNKNTEIIMDENGNFSIMNSNRTFLYAVEKSKGGGAWEFRDGAYYRKGDEYFHLNFSISAPETKKINNKTYAVVKRTWKLNENSTYLQFLQDFESWKGVRCTELNNLIEYIEINGTGIVLELYPIILKDMENDSTSYKIIDCSESPDDESCKECILCGANKINISTIFDDNSFIVAPEFTLGTPLLYHIFWDYAPLFPYFPFEITSNFSKNEMFDVFITNTQCKKENFSTPSGILEGYNCTVNYKANSTTGKIIKYEGKSLSSNTVSSQEKPIYLFTWKIQNRGVEKIYGRDAYHLIIEEIYEYGEIVSTGSGGGSTKNTKDILVDKKSKILLNETTFRSTIWEKGEEPYITETLKYRLIEGNFSAEWPLM